MIKKPVYLMLVFIGFCYGNFAHATLLLSEYVEGSSYNKALELYNSGPAIDFGSGLYSIAIYTNGSTSASRTVTLNGAIAQDATLVLANSRADTSLLTLADLVSASLNFNGDDAIALMQDGVIIDRIGQIGVDPGSAWSTGSVTTVNATLRRMSGISAGDSQAYDAFDPAAQWQVYAEDDFSDLGRHAIASGATGPTTGAKKALAVAAPNTLLLAALGLVVLLILTQKAKRPVSKHYGRLVV